MQMDGDGQHNPLFLADVVRPVAEGRDMCIGSRFITKEGFQTSPCAGWASTSPA
ncbi:MAG: hypothetical protein ACLR7U_02785 [Ruthenibacterium lactatiformans]